MAAIGMSLLATASPNSLTSLAYELFSSSSLTVSYASSSKLFSLLEDERKFLVFNKVNQRVEACSILLVM